MHVLLKLPCSEIVLKTDTTLLTLFTFLSDQYISKS